MSWLGVALLGGVGALARFGLDAFVERRVRGEFPAGTLVVNVTGSFVLGLLTGLGVAGTTLLLLGSAVLGSYTTFSTWILETERLAEDGEDRLAVANVVGSLVAGLAAAGAGWGLGAL